MGLLIHRVELKLSSFSLFACLLSLVANPPCGVETPVEKRLDKI